MKNVNMILWRREKHEYLGVDQDYSLPGEVSITTDNYLKSPITGFPEEIRGGRGHQVQKRITFFRWNQKESVFLLMKAELRTFTNLSRKCFSRARKIGDIQLPITFLANKLRALGEDDLYNQKILMKYIRRGSTYLSIVKWCLEASCETHDDW